MHAHGLSPPGPLSSRLVSLILDRDLGAVALLGGMGNANALLYMYGCCGHIGAARACTTATAAAAAAAAA